MGVFRWPAAVVVVIVAFIAAVPAPAQTLTSADVEKFVDSMPEIRALTERHDFDPRAYPTPRGQFLDSVVLFIEDKDLIDTFEPAMRKYGFDGHIDWADIGNRTIGAFIAIKAAEEIPGALAELDAAREQLLADPQLSDAQKQAIIDSLGALAQLPGADNPDIAVVRPFADRIEAAMGPALP